MRPIFLPYRFGSSSCRTLSESLRTVRSKRVRVDGNYRPYRNHLIINWGYGGEEPRWFNTDPWGGFPLRLLNSPLAVNRASNKLSAMRLLADSGDVQVPEFTTDREIAATWAGEEGVSVVCRTLLRANSGRGIVMATSPEEIVAAPLYVRYFKKIHEYRIHIFNGNVISIQQKRRPNRVEPEDTNYQIRNHDNGWVFCRDSCDLNGRAPNSKRQTIVNNSINAVRALGLDFGGVDVVWNNHHSECRVLEVNTAPGMEGGTVDAYNQVIRSML